MDICKIEGKAVLDSGDIGIRLRRNSGEVFYISYKAVKEKMETNQILITNAVLGANGTLYIANDTDIII